MGRDAVTHALSRWWEYQVVLDFFLRLLIQRATPTIAMIRTIGTPTTIASVDEEETAIGSVTCGWVGVGSQSTLPLSQSALVVVNVWYSISSSLMVPFWIPATMPGAGTMPVKFARYHTVPNAGGAGAAVWYLLELSVKSGAKSVHVLPPSVLC